MSLSSQCLQWSPIALGHKSQILNMIWTCLPFQAQLRLLTLFFSGHHTHCLFSGIQTSLASGLFTHAVSCTRKDPALLGLLSHHFSAVKLIHQERLPWPPDQGRPPCYVFSEHPVLLLHSIGPCNCLFWYLFKDCLLGGRVTSDSVMYLQHLEHKRCFQIFQKGLGY